MEYFIHLREFHVVVCKKCQYAVLPSHIDTHFTKKPDHDLPKVERRRIADAVARINGLISNEVVLGRIEFPFPPATCEPVFGLAEPRSNSMRCTFQTHDGNPCPYISCHARGIKEHCKDKHGWENPKGKGRPGIRGGRRTVPWRTKVKCQRFFKQGYYSQFFEVQSQDGHSHQAPEKPGQEAQKVVEERMSKAAEKARQRIEIGDENQEPDAWLKEVRWHRHLVERTAPEWTALIQPVGEDEGILSKICDSFGRVIDSAITNCCEEVVGEAALKRVNAVEYGKKADKSFTADMEDHTRTKYQMVWIKVLCYIYRVQSKWEAYQAEVVRREREGDQSSQSSQSRRNHRGSPNEEAREDTCEPIKPPYRFTRAQQRAFTALVERARASPEIPGSEDMEPMSEAQKQQVGQLDRQCLAFCIELLDHTLVGNEYSSAIISGLAILGIKEGGGWVAAIDYTGYYSGVIKFARLMVIQKAYEEWTQAIRSSEENGYPRAEAIELCETPYEITRRMVDRFMGLEGAARGPTPMDWIWSKRSYGMKIRYTTTVEGKVRWEGDTIIYGDIRMSMSQLQDMVHTVVRKARRRLMEELMLIEVDSEGEVDPGHVPPIDWGGLQDNMAMDQTGWSFLQDPRNQFSVDGRWWVWNKIFRDRALQRRFVSTVQGDGGVQWKKKAIDRYERALVQCQEELLFICHFTSGGPARAPEIMSIRHRNTANGGIRNIGIEDGMMVWFTMTHKGYRSTQKVKIIHRYLSREAGELWMYYLWLVLPFWERVQVSIDEHSQASPFMWPYHRSSQATRAEEARQKDPTRGQPGPEDSPTSDDSTSDEEDDTPAQAAPKSGPWHREWTSERMRKIIQRESHSSIGVQLNISAWRQMITAIDRKYLEVGFGVDEGDEEDGSRPEDAGEKMDEMRIRQSGHGRQMAEDIYGRLMSEAPGHRSSERGFYRHVSREWHRFLEFPSARQGIGVQVGRTKVQSFYHQVAREMQIQRWQWMKNMPKQARLEALVGPTARFRSVQEPVLDAIMTGKSPIIVVMGTGAGKSMLFMLPAFCVQGGTSIVIVPLVSLQYDLKRRCDESKITCRIWDGQRAGESASIVLVTPESAVTKGFKEFMSRKIAMHQLDHIYVDEAHTVLAGRSNFRPKLRRLGELMEVGVQMVFMTATLRPRDEARFCQIMNISGKDRTPFRDRTSRPNIQYQVRRYQPTRKRTQDGEVQDGCIPAICTLVAEMKGKYPAPATIIIYSQSIKRTKALGEALECPVYYRDVDSRQGKEARLRNWMGGQEDQRVVVATNAMGLGVDKPNTRAVIHASMPSQLPDFVQESGRAGRDGLPSESIVMVAEKPAIPASKASYKKFNSRMVPTKPAKEERITIYRPRTGGNSEAEEVDPDSEEFIQGDQCRRIVLDRAMDDRFNRMGCEEGEEVCDVCQVRVERERMIEDSGIGIETQESLPMIDPSRQAIPITEQDRIEFDQQEQQRKWVQFHINEQHQQEGSDIEEFERQLQEWQDQCPICFVRGLESHDHTMDECSHEYADEVRGEVQSRLDDFQDEKSQRRFERFSCCMYCYIPQAICAHWEQKSEQGWWKARPGVDCQYKGIMIPGFVSMLNHQPAIMVQIVAGLSGEEGLDVERLEKWLHSKIWWARVEVSGMVRVFHQGGKTFMGDRVDSLG